MKHCSQCFEVLPMNKIYFYATKRNKNGLASQCKKCVESKRRNQKKKYNKRYSKENRASIYMTQRIYNNKNKEKVLNYQREYRKKYYQDNKDAINERSRKNYIDNKEHILKRMSKHRQNNPEQYRNAVQRYNNRKRKLISTFTIDQWRQCLAHFNHQCAYCGSTESLEQEHVIPVSRGGHYTPDNIIPACRSCNASKNNKIMQDWFTQHENYSVERMANILKYVQKNKTEVNI